MADVPHLEVPGWVRVVPDGGLRDADDWYAHADPAARMPPGEWAALTPLARQIEAFLHQGAQLDSRIVNARLLAQGEMTQAEWNAMSMAEREQVVAVAHDIANDQEWAAAEPLIQDLIANVPPGGEIPPEENEREREEREREEREREEREREEREREEREREQREREEREREHG